MTSGPHERAERAQKLLAEMVMARNGSEHEEERVLARALLAALAELDHAKSVVLLVADTLRYTWTNEPGFPEVVDALTKIANSEQVDESALLKVMLDCGWEVTPNFDAEKMRAALDRHNEHS